MSCRKDRNGMVEITVTELVALEHRAHNGNLTKKDVRKIFALIVQQQALIEQLAAEIAKKDRMLERATWVLDRTGSCPKTCDLMRNLCAARACWLAWLEKEEQGAE